MSAWYYSKNGQQYGPVNGESLLRLIKEGVVKQSDAVWTEGMDEWERVAEVSASTLLQTIPDVVGAVNEPVQIGDFPRFVADFSEVSIAESSRSVKDTSVPADQYSDNYSYEVNPSFFFIQRQDQAFGLLRSSCPCDRHLLCCRGSDSCSVV